jgi:methionine synthase I (cobalamin-dependent)
VLLADGATGTNYQTMGIEPGLAPSGCSTRLASVVELHRAFVEAGSTSCSPARSAPRRRLVEGLWRDGA